MGDFGMGQQERDPAIEAALRTAASLTGMEVVVITRIHETSMAFDDVLGDLPGVEPGSSIPRSDSFCQFMLEGAHRATACAASDPIYSRARIGQDLGIRSYVGVPIHNAAGDVVGTLCGVDRGEVVVDDSVIGVLEELAGIVARHLPGVDAPDVVVRRTSGGWHIDGTPPAAGTATSLVEAMTLADLLSPDPSAAPRRPPRADDETDEVGQLRATVGQLEHALAARVVVEQAIGVLTERLQTSPRAAFERLRKAARCRGRRVHDLAREVVESAHDRGVPLPPELHSPKR